MFINKLSAALLTGTVVLSLSAVSYAGVCSAAIHTGNKYMGNTKCTQGTLSSIEVLGDIVTSDTTITESAKITGTARLVQGQIANATITGDGYFSNITMSGTTSLTGRLNTNNTVFTGDLDVYSPDVTLNGSTTKNIDNEDVESTQDNIYLNGTHVNGNITFKSGHGIVHVDSSSSISGTVTGGKVVSV